jgi:RNA polymerase sigma-70 factor (sigma-E family)
VRHDEEFETFVRDHRGQLLRTATVLTAGDGFLAEDLVQGSLVRLYLAWGKARSGNVEAYARRVLVNAFIDHRRRPVVRRESAVAAPPDRVFGTDVFGSALAEIDHTRLLEALAGLPARMRAAVVLRHVEDLSVEDVAAALGCSTGTVKSQTARGIAKLRDALGSSQPVVATVQGDLS